MSKKAPNIEALEFGKRLVALLESRGQKRRGAGAYLARRYRVRTVTANAWLNGEHRPNTTIAKQLAVDHGSTFDELYFGQARSASETPEAYRVTPELDLAADIRELTMAVSAVCDWISRTRPVEAPLLLRDLQDIARAKGPHDHPERSPLHAVIQAMATAKA